MTDCLVIILIHPPLSVPWLGPPGPLGHDDLVHPQHCAGGIGGVLEGPLLGQHQIQHVGLQTVLDIASLSVNVEADVLVSFTVSSVQLADDFLGLDTRILSQHSYLPGQLDLSGSSSCCHLPVLAQTFEHVHTIVHCSLDVVHVVVCSAPDDNGAHSALLLPNPEHDNLGVSKLVNVDSVGHAHLLRGGGSHLGESSSAGCPSKSPHVPLAHQSDGHHVVLVDVVHGQVTELPPGNNHVHTGVSNGLDLLLQLRLLASAEGGELLRGLDEDGPLGLCLQGS